MTTRDQMSHGSVILKKEVIPRVTDMDHLVLSSCVLTHDVVLCTSIYSLEDTYCILIYLLYLDMLHFL